MSHVNPRPMEALGNTFLAFDARPPNPHIHNPAQLAVAHRSSCHQALFLQQPPTHSPHPPHQKPYPPHHLAVSFFNNDGSKAETCGNALRCLGALSMRERSSPHADILVLSASPPRVASCRRVPFKAPHENPADAFHDRIAVDMGPLLTHNEVQRLASPIPEALEAFALRIPNPHYLLHIPKALSPQRLALLHGASLAASSPFSAEGANVSFFNFQQNSLLLATHERGAGATPACGSAACAAYIVAHILNLTANNNSSPLPSPLTIRMTGGNLLVSSPNRRILMEGPCSLNAHSKPHAHPKPHAHSKSHAHPKPHAQS